ncbi:MAG: hypothetical protein ACK5Q5_14585 [Planctomycetaceae bacterium]
MRLQSRMKDAELSLLQDGNHRVLAEMREYLDQLTTDYETEAQIFDRYQRRLKAIEFDTQTSVQEAEKIEDEAERREKLDELQAAAVAKKADAEQKYRHELQLSVDTQADFNAVLVATDAALKKDADATARLRSQMELIRKGTAPGLAAMLVDLEIAERNAAHSAAAYSIEFLDLSDRIRSLTQLHEALRTVIRESGDETGRHADKLTELSKAAEIAVDQLSRLEQAHSQSLEAARLQRQQIQDRIIDEIAGTEEELRQSGRRNETGLERLKLELSLLDLTDDERQAKLSLHDVTVQFRTTELELLSQIAQTEERIRAMRDGEFDTSTADTRLIQLQQSLNLERQLFDVRQQQINAELQSHRRAKIKEAEVSAREIVRERSLRSMRRILQSTPISEDARKVGDNAGVGRLAVRAAAERIGIPGDDIEIFGDIAWKAAQVSGNRADSLIGKLQSLMQKRAEMQKENAEKVAQLRSAADQHQTTIVAPIETQISEFATKIEKLSEERELLESSTEGRDQAEIDALSAEIDRVTEQKTTAEDSLRREQEVQATLQSAISDLASDNLHAMVSAANELAQSVSDLLDQYWDTELFIREKQIALFGEQYRGQKERTRSAAQYADAIKGASTVDQVGRITSLARRELGGAVRDPFIRNMLKDAIHSKRIEFENQQVQKDSYLTLRELLRVSVQQLEELRKGTGSPAESESASAANSATSAASVDGAVRIIEHLRGSRRSYERFGGDGASVGPASAREFETQMQSWGMKSAVPSQIRGFGEFMQTPRVFDKGIGELLLDLRRTNDRKPLPPINDALTKLQAETTAFQNDVVGALTKSVKIVSNMTTDVQKVRESVKNLETQERRSLRAVGLV